MVVALVPDLLGTRKQRLDALAELNQRVAVVRLLDDSGDELADAVLVLVVHHLALGLADPLEDHLLGGLRRDAAEVVGGHVARLDLVLVRGEDLRVELGVLGLAKLAGLGVDDGLLLLGDLGEELLLELGRQDQLEDAEIGGLAVEIDTRVLGRAGALLIGGEQGILERRHQRLGIDALLLLETLQGLDDLATQAITSNSGIRLERRISLKGMRTASPSISIATLSSSASASVPVKLRCPSIGSLVRTLTWRPTKRR